jgi:hypothetical protein
LDACHVFGSCSDFGRSRSDTGRVYSHDLPQVQESIMSRCIKIAEAIRHRQYQFRYAAYATGWRWLGSWWLGINHTT